MAAKKTRKTAKKRAKTSSRKVASKSELTSQSTGIMQMIRFFVVFYLVNALVVFLATALAPTQVVLGTHLFSPMTALLQSMAVFTLIVVGAMPVIELLANHFKLKLTDRHWMVSYWLINAAGLWMVGRFAQLLGLGIAGWLVAVILGLVLDIVQGMVVKSL